MTCSLFYNNVLADIITVMSPLFAAIGLSIGLGSRLLRTDDGEDDHGGHIGDHLEELVRDGDAGDLKPDLQRIAEAEEQAGQQDAARVPTPP